MDVIEELKFLGEITKKWGGRGGGCVGGGVGLVGGQGGCERRIEVFVKIKKKNGGGRGGGWGDQVGCERRIEFFGKIHKKKIGGGGSGGEGVRWKGGRVGAGSGWM